MDAHCLLHKELSMKICDIRINKSISVHNIKLVLVMINFHLDFVLMSARSLLLMAGRDIASAETLPWL